MTTSNNHVRMTSSSQILLIGDICFFGVSILASILLSSRPSRALQPPLPTPTTLPKIPKGSSIIQSLTDDNNNDLIFTVDRQNNPTKEGASRKDVYLKKLWHRATYIIIRYESCHHNRNNNNNDTRSRQNEEFLFLVQRHTSPSSNDGPSKLDPTPGGGMVRYGESYEENAKRDIYEEMGISVEMIDNTTAKDGPQQSENQEERSATNDTTLPKSSKKKKNTNNTMKRLLTFPYEDNHVRCHGELFEVVFTGDLSQFKTRKKNHPKKEEEEECEILPFTLSELKIHSTETAEEWTPDGLHALKLYLQYHHDHSIQRRLLRGYSSGNLDSYRLRPKPRAIFFDCDDCLYFDGWKVADRLTAKIESWCTSSSRANLPPGKAYELYKTHGTALRGLLAEGHLEHCELAIDAYLEDVHDLPIHDMLSPDEELRDMILRMDPTVKRYVFTASVRHHAERCLDALGIRDLFVDIIDTKACGLVTKHSTDAFEKAMEIAGETDPEVCVFLDDSIKNIKAAREIGWRSVLVGRVGRDCGKTVGTDHAEHEIDRIHQLPLVFPEIFIY